MPVIVGDSTAADIVADVIQTLQSSTMAAGGPAFSAVQETRSEADFLGTNGAFNTSQVGVIVSRPAREYGTDSSMDFKAMLRLELVVKTFFQIAPGGDETGGIEALDALVDLVREALLMDRLRSGLARRIMWKGKIIDGTSVDGEPKTLKLAKNQPTNVFAASVPIAIGWTKDL